MAAVLENLSVEQLKKGVCRTEHGSICVACGAVFEEGQVYAFDGRWYDAAHAVEEHMRWEHADWFDGLLGADSKYVTLTDRQKTLLSLLHDGWSDKDMADKLGVAPATIRHQKFMFRERAKQARLYLALYELAMGDREGGGAPPPVHDEASPADERRTVTKKERDKILSAHFESLDPLKLRVFPAKEKKKIAVLTKIAEAFQPGERYPETEVNRVLAAVYDDYVTIRRALIEYGFLERTKDCRQYWRR